MIKRLSLVTLFAAFLVGCGDAPKSGFKEIFASVKDEYAPDRRNSTFEVTLDEKGVLRGAATEKAAVEALVSLLAQSGIEAVDSVKMLPDADLGERLYGLTALSVINFRYGDGYAQESATQTVLGAPLRILEKRNGWTRAITPEGYFAWVPSGSIAAKTEAEMNAWRTSKRLIITTYYTILRAEPTEAGVVVCDAVWGGIVEYKGERGGYYQVVLPNGKEAYLQKSAAEDFDGWLASRSATPENIIAQGKSFLGFPYMWGGTSVKAMDCSGFTKTVFFLNGIILERDASQQARTGEDIDISGGLQNLQMGDLIFFGSRATHEKPERVTHVGIYIGGGEFIHSATSVRINSLLPEADNYYESSPRLIRARRILNSVGTKGITYIKEHPWYLSSLK